MIAPMINAPPPACPVPSVGHAVHAGRVRIIGKTVNLSLLRISITPIGWMDSPAITGLEYDDLAILSMQAHRFQFAMVLGWLGLTFAFSAAPLPGQTSDAQWIARGRQAFQVSCVDCHDADRALSKRKSASGWLETVRRMSRLDNADIAQSDIVPIAAYLASKDQPSGSFSDAPGVGMDDQDAERDSQESSSSQSLADQLLGQSGSIGSGLSTSAAISTLWRNGNDNLETPNFFADVWLGADWQPDGPLRAKATACTSCHSDQTGGSGFTLEMVEAYAAIDLLAFAGRCPKPERPCGPNFEAELKAGRFVVPFGQFSSMVHPGAHRSVTVPLMFNMGRQVFPQNSRPPVLPMPYSDEGVDIRTKAEYRDLSATINVYGVNGLQGFGPGIQFTPSRSYSDNNSDVAFGSRATVGSKHLRFGASVMSGRMQNEGSSNLAYHLSGVDSMLTLLDNQLRLYFEYALRRNDSLFGERQIAYGTVTELDALLWDDPNLRMLVRYDTLEHRDFSGREGIRRFTWGLSTTVFGGSTLMINHEHWRFSDRGPNTDLLGLRWLAVF